VNARYTGSVHRYSARAEPGWTDFAWDYAGRALMRPSVVFVAVEAPADRPPRLCEVRVTGLSLTPDGAEVKMVPGHRKGEPPRPLPASVSLLSYDRSRWPAFAVAVAAEALELSAGAGRLAA
jgi:hypothetical protein